MSFRVRPARNEDFQAIYEMAKLTGGGFTNLPADKGTLVAKLARSEAPSRSDEERPDGDLFVFVLENAETRPDPRHLPGVQPGRPWPSLLFLPDQHADPDLARARPDLPRRDADPVHRFRGQLGGRRPVPPSRRARRRPRRAARAQPLSVHQAASRALRRPVLAELRGVIDEAGGSPFWDAIAGRFFGMTFQEADASTAPTAPASSPI